MSVTRLLSIVLSLGSLACAPKIIRPDRVPVHSDCIAQASLAKAVWQQNAVSGDWVETSNYAREGISLYVGGEPVSTTAGIERLRNGEALARQQQELDDTALGHAVFIPAMTIGGVALTAGIAAFSAMAFVDYDNVSTEVLLAGAAGGGVVMIGGGVVLLVGVMSIDSWHLHQVSQEVVSDAETLELLNRSIPEACVVRDRKQQSLERFRSPD